VQHDAAAEDTSETASVTASQTASVDLATYVWQKRVIRDLPAETSPFRQELVVQIGRMIDAGHLLPYYAKRGELNARWYFTNPGDLLGTLGRAYPYLPPECQLRLRGYLAQELTAYPPWTDRLNSPSDKGTPRQDFHVPEHLWEWQEGRLYSSLPRVHNVYAIWQYVDATDDTSRIRPHWAAIQSFYNSHREDVTSYMGGVAAPIALARLARRMEDQQAERAAVQDAVAALQAIRREAEWRTPMLRRYGFPVEWSEPFILSGFDLLSLTPEVARYVRDHAETRDAIVAHVEQGIDRWPMWFVSQASCFSRYYGESHAISPHYSAMIYPVKALLERESPEQLQTWVDAEDAPRGDLFFLERLVLALEALGQEQWVDLRNP
jgi:hypothetical protein